MQVKVWSGLAVHQTSEVGTVGELEETKAKLGAAGIPVVGITDHTIFKSIYFHDPNGHRVELAANVGTPEMYQRLDDVKVEMLQEWSRTKRAPKQAAWMHEKEFAQGDRWGPLALTATLRRPRIRTVRRTNRAILVGWR